MERDRGSHVSATDCFGQMWGGAGSYLGEGVQCNVPVDQVWVAVQGGF
ncbi:hypothetical protein FPSE_08975 [Fusarium pseudograminearum CS3096]|uniref:Uncharacterized protein n=1 Tax=Fusarium pseudograminearum (strain CS3096) TaxID=1028729 RepID=K3VE41_FUSPC|nr:hypothetical protein FPSE_08975 [Fusarium pseudograminearum CS3096]EKJ70823.1 hypothetical protein FPSE_08975 [Fusarium pseudograminearum CS3096]